MVEAEIESVGNPSVTARQSGGHPRRLRNPNKSPLQFSSN